MKRGQPVTQFQVLVPPPRVEHPVVRSFVADCRPLEEAGEGTGANFERARSPQSSKSKVQPMPEAHDCP
ncbi:unnamed protein product [Ectocarpus sp. 12 AP-2014]